MRKGLALGRKSEIAPPPVAEAGGQRVHPRNLPSGVRHYLKGKACILIGLSMLRDHAGERDLVDGDRTYNLTEWGRTAAELIRLGSQA